jgi:hypothetical protein
MGGINSYDTRPYKDHGGSPAITMYVISDDSEQMQKLSCIWCKRTIADIKGHIDTIISTPVPIQDFGIGMNIRCKLCHQNYRLVVSQTYIPVVAIVTSPQR